MSRRLRSPRSTGPGPGAGVGALVGILFPPTLIAGAVVGAGAGGLTGHLTKGMSRGDLKDLGAEVAKKGNAAVIVIGKSKLDEQLEKATARANKVIEQQIDADADDLEDRDRGRG